MQISYRLQGCLPGFLATLSLASGCNHRPERIVEPSFYYWKTSFRLDSLSKEMIPGLKVKKLYVKFFDLTWNAEQLQAVPVAMIHINEHLSFAKQPEIVPVVFITNECMQCTNLLQIPALAERIFGLIKQLTNINKLTGIQEVQLDCDWTISTKENYFALLNAMQRFTKQEKIQLSATIRLYQSRYFKQAGVPPVDKGLLMCYNMGNMKDPAAQNSILDNKELRKYTVNLDQYPLPLDIALPLFGWKVLFRKNTYAGLIRELPTELLLKNTIADRSGNLFNIKKGFSVNGYKFEAGDLLRDEQVSFGELENAAEYLSSKVGNGPLTVSLYHLDSLTLSKYSLHELETIFDRLR